ncbi:hypothetical protein [Methanocella conradii]|uniref:hypothetical protein n=1 Tax=Methanocella conradii TaxID=1175444 RepID=UPI00157CA2C8|nr:hypothetical protein [Methanocella conradii]
MNAEFVLHEDEVLFLYDDRNTVGIVKAAGARQAYVETDEEELIQFLEPEDLIAVSCFSGGERAMRMARCMLFLVREGGVPLLVLKKGHPATRRIPLVVSAGSRIVLSGCIVPGTHPEQDVLCGKGEMDGITLKAVKGGVILEGGGSPRTAIQRFQP